MTAQSYSSNARLKDGAVGTSFWSRAWQNHAPGYLFLLPWFIGFFGLTIGPIITSLYLSFFVNDLEAGKVLGVERGIPCSAAVREVVAPTLDAKNQIALNFVANLGDLLGALPPPPPAAAGEIDVSLLRVLSQEVAFGARSPEDAGKFFVTEAAAILARAA